MSLDCLNIEDLIFVAASLPKLFCEVLEGSARLRKKIRQHKFENRSMMRQFTLKFKNGTLYVLCRRTTIKVAEASLFPAFSRHKKLQIIDPEATLLDYCTTGARIIQDYIKFHDLEGNDVCSKNIMEGVGDFGLERYVWHVIDADQEEHQRKHRSGPAPNYSRWVEWDTFGVGGVRR